jgi:hypothetical protein
MVYSIVRLPYGATLIFYYIRFHLHALKTAASGSYFVIRHLHRGTLGESSEGAEIDRELTLPQSEGFLLEGQKKAAAP